MKDARPREMIVFALRIEGVTERGKISACVDLLKRNYSGLICDPSLLMFYGALETIIWDIFFANRNVPGKMRSKCMLGLPLLLEERRWSKTVP